MAEASGCPCFPLHSHDQQRALTVPSLRTGRLTQVSCKAQLALGGTGRLQSQGPRGKLQGEVMKDG